MVAGALMTLFVLMLWKKRTRRYQLMVLILGAAIILFTYIPGISAKDIGLYCQKQRLNRLISELKLTDARTGKLMDDINTKRINQDSLSCEKYKDVCSVISYVREEMGRDAFREQYGDWSHSEYDFYYDTGKNSSGDLRIDRRASVDVGEYRLMLPSDNYNLNYDGRTITVETADNEEIILRYPVSMMVSMDSTLMHHPERLLTYRNDSILLVLESINVDDSSVTYVDRFGYQLFKKQVKKK